MKKIYLTAVLLLGTIGCTFGQLPQDHPYQKTLREYMGSLSKQDFEVNLEPFQFKKSYFNSVDDVFRTWLFFNRCCAKKGLRVNASYFTLNSIEADGQVNMMVGKEQFMNTVSTAFWADWSYEGNPHHGSRSVKLRAFVAAAVDMMMMDQDYERGNNRRSDFLGMQMIRWGYSYGVAKNVLPQRVQDAFEKGLIKMFKRLERWGPTGVHADMDMGAIVGMLYTAKYVDSQDLTQRAHQYIDNLMNKHLADPGYVDHGGAYDAGYNGMSLHFINWGAQLSGYQPLIEALRKMSKLKAYLTLPDPDGKRFGPFHSSPSSSQGAPHDQATYYARNVGIARYADDAAYLAFKGGRKTILAKSEMIRWMQDNVHYFNDPNSGGLTTPSDRKPDKWRPSHWSDGNSMNATAFYYKDGLYDRLRSLKQNRSPLTKPPFLRSGEFTESFADKFLSVKRDTYGTIIFNDRLSWWTKDETDVINGFGGGNLSAFWTPETGSVMLGGTRTAHEGGLDLKDWRIWPVHALSGETVDGRAFSSGIQRYPKANYELNRSPAKVTITGDLTNKHSDMLDGLQGRADYQRVFKIKENGVQVTTSVNADGSNKVKELYEILPVYRRNARRQSSATPTSIEFNVNGNWKQASTNLQEVSSIRLSRFNGQVFIDFKEPQQVKLSAKEFYRIPDKKSGMQARNIMIDLLGSGGESAKLENTSVSYFMRSSKAEPNENWGDGGGDEPGKDMTPPEVEISISPSNPDNTQRVKFTSTASDDGGIKRINIYVDGKKVKTCSDAGTCSVKKGPFSDGKHTYHARAVDASSQSNEKSTQKKNFSVSVKSKPNNPPTTVQASLQERSQFLESTVKDVSDPDGDAVSLVYDWRVNNKSLAVINFPFDVNLGESENNTVKDYSTHENNGVMGEGKASPGWIESGKRAGAFVFDGKDDFVRVPSKKSLNDLKHFTIETWIKQDNWGADWATIMSKPFSKKSWQAPWAVFKLGRNSNKDNLNFQITVGKKKAVSLQSKSDIPANKWTHIAGTYDGKNLKLYINGELDQTLAVDKPLVAGKKTDTFIGRNSAVASKQEHFRGVLDEVRLFKQALTNEQIKEHYAGRYKKLSLTQTHPEEKWKVAVTANDAQTNSNPGISNVVTTEGEQKETQEKENETHLSANFPNPFSGSTTIPYYLKAGQKITIKLFDISGRYIQTIFEGKRPSGKGSAKFNAAHLASGIYFYRLFADDKILTGKMTYIK